MFGRLFVAGLHVKERKVGVDELLVWFQFFGFMALLDGAGEVAFAVISHTEGELAIEMRRIFRQNALEFGNGAVEITLAEIEHGVVVSFLLRHSTLTKFGIARLLRARKTLPVWPLPHVLCGFLN